MTVEEVRGNSEGGDWNYDNFPVGMRVLAVDDDPICLKVLEGLLWKCQYHVTTTSQARVALKMLMENRDRFDLVISDVYMPDMDGFKLLELVGLEMDLPVIMLGANNDPKLVMKGVTHGACDYLVKPARIEELRNIWQHVIRRKKFDSKTQSKSAYEDKALQGNGEVCQGPKQTANADQSVKLNKKRKDEEDEGEDNGEEHEDPATQKKPCVVWPIDLHRKFVAAVNQLGIEKAVPKRILDIMNFEGLTRENVASHLQDGGEFMQLGSLHQQADAITNAENIDVNGSCQNQVAASAPSTELQSVGGKLLPRSSHQQLIVEPDVANRKRNIGSMEQSAIDSNDSGNGSTRKRIDREYGITLEDLLQHSGKKLYEVAKELCVSRSTLKRMCRQHNIHRWPPRKAKNDNFSRLPREIVQPTEEHVGDSCPTPLPSPDYPVEQDDNSEPNIMPVAGIIQDDSNMIVKVTYKNEIIKFYLSLSSRKVDLEVEVVKRLPLSIGSFSLTYLDEDQEWIKVACDDDLRMCVSRLRSLGENTIRMKINS